MFRALRSATGGAFFLQAYFSEMCIRDRLYGPDVKLEHQTFTINYVDNYVYDEETRTYYAVSYTHLASTAPACSPAARPRC